MESQLSHDRSSQTAPPQDRENGSEPFEAMRQLGSASIDMMSAWTDAWSEVLTNRGAPVGEAMLKTFANPTAWPTALLPILDEIREALKLPTFSDMPTHDLFKLPSPTPLFELMHVSQEYAAISVPIWTKACERFIAEVKKRHEADRDRAQGAGDLLDIWNNVLDLTLMEFNRSGEFAKAQQWLLHSAAQHRRELGGAFERLGRAVGMPTRTEMTDVYQRLHDLTREVHSLRREVRALRQAPRSAGAPQRAR
jgi:hypothetical protein